MGHNQFKINLSNLDEARFGVRTALAEGVSGENYDKMTSFCVKQGVKLLVARCNASEIEAVHKMEQGDFNLMDTLIYMKRDLEKEIFTPEIEFFPVRHVRADESETVRRIALLAFRDYPSHYHNDPRLDPSICDALYADLATEACLKRDDINEVLVCEVDGELVGFAILHINKQKQGNPFLTGVLPSFQGKGVNWSLGQEIVNWFLSRGVKEGIATTQVTNLRTQRWTLKRGYVPFQYVYTFHKWYD